MLTDAVRETMALEWPANGDWRSCKGAWIWAFEGETVVHDWEVRIWTRCLCVPANRVWKIPYLRNSTHDSQQGISAWSSVTSHCLDCQAHSRGSGSILRVVRAWKLFASRTSKKYLKDQHRLDHALQNNVIHFEYILYAFPDSTAYLPDDITDTYIKWPSSCVCWRSCQLRKRTG